MIVMCTYIIYICIIYEYIVLVLPEAGVDHVHGRPLVTELETVQRDGAESDEEAEQEEEEVVVVGAESKEKRVRWCGSAGGGWV